MSVKLSGPILAPAKRAKSLHEQMVPGMTMQDLNDTMSEFYKCNEEMWGMVKDMKLEERKALNEMIRGHVSKAE